jgi:dihydrofolate reductase
MTISLIWAQGNHRVIGRNGTLPWSVPEDLARFRTLTRGMPIVMGRTTWESLPPDVRPLPGRRNIVLTRGAARTMRGADTASDLIGVGWILRGTPAWGIGGAQVYNALMPYATRLEVTEIDVNVPDGDTFAPHVDHTWFNATADPEQGWHTSITGLRYRFATYVRDTAPLTLPTTPH